MLSIGQEQASKPVGSTAWSGTTPRLSVIIPHFQQAVLLERCLESLEAQCGAPPFEVIVVDNGSARMPTEICNKFPRVRLLLETTKGPGPARNRGAREARAPILLFIDADCVADPGWLATADQHLNEFPETDIIGGDIRILPAHPARMTAIECYEELFAYQPERMIRRYRFPVTCNLAVRKPVFDAIGPFIPGLLIAEDVEWGRRAHKMGHDIVWAPDMKIATPARENFSEVMRRWDRQVGQQHAETMQMSYGRARWLLKTLAMPLSPFAEVPAIMMSPRLKSPTERLGAFMVLAWTRLWRTIRMVQLMTGVIDNLWLVGAWRRTPPNSNDVNAVSSGHAPTTGGKHVSL
jgi:glycosyltransferase involved in cell wall biosynthesis